MHVELFSNILKDGITVKGSRNINSLQLDQINKILNIKLSPKTVTKDSKQWDLEDMIKDVEQNGTNRSN